MIFCILFVQQIKYHFNVVEEKSGTKVTNAVDVVIVIVISVMFVLYSYFLQLGEPFYW